jgi:hypothetical protein
MRQVADQRPPLYAARKKWAELTSITSQQELMPQATDLLNRVSWHRQRLRKENELVHPEAIESAQNQK